MNGEYQLVIDTWEGQAEIDEAVLLANGVAGMIIRLNDMNGGHHLDENFAAQWEQARAFCRAPYFVYNPWVDGTANYIWLATHMPADATAVFLDVEVRKSGYSPATYGVEVKKFYDLVRLKWNTAIYTGEWFLSMLSSWPAADYWWAQYPFEFYQEQDIHLTWDELRARLQKYDKPFNMSRIPGALRMWQFSGDTLILPGNSKIMDVNVFYGSRQELEDWLGGVDTTPPDGGRVNGTATEKLGKTVTTRSEPVVASGNAMGLVAPYAKVEFTEIVEDLGNPTWKWLKLADGRYANYLYPNSLGQVTQRFTILTQPTTDTPPTGGIPATIENTVVLKDDAGAVLGTWKGTLTKQ